METKTLIILAVSIMLIASLLTSILHSKGGNSLFSFFFADKSLRVSQVTHLLLSSSFAMNGLLYQTFLGFRIGWAAIFLQVLWCLSFILLSSKAGKIKQLTSNGTMHSAISVLFGPTAGKLAAIATIIGFTIQIGWELIVGVSVFGTSFTNSPNYSWWLIISITAICVIYTILGGLKGNVWANTLQNWVAIVALLIICAFLIINYNPTSIERPWDGGSIGRLISELGISFFITNALFSVFWQFVDFSAWQNLASGEGDKKQTKYTLYWSSLWIFFFPGVVGTIAGMYLRGNANLDPNNLFPYIIKLLSQNPILLIITVAGCISAMLSTIDGLLLSASTAALWDLFFIKEVNYLKSSNNTTNQKKITNIGKGFIILFGLIGSTLIYYITLKFKIDIFSIVYLVTISQMVLVPVVLLMLFSKIGSKFIFGDLSIALGLLSGILLVSYSISKGNQNLLAWSPTISLGISCIPILINLFPKSYEK